MNILRDEVHRNAKDHGKTLARRASHAEIYMGR